MKKLYFFAAGASALALSLGAYALTSAQLTALSASSVVVTDLGMTPIATNPVNNSIVPLWNAPSVVSFRFSGPVEIRRNGGAVAKLVKPRMFGGGYTDLATYPASDESLVYVNPANPNELLVKVEGYDFEDVATGYTVILETALLEVGGVENEECSTHFNFQNTPRWETDPASGALLWNAAEELQSVSVKFSGSVSTLDFAETNVSQRPRTILYRANSETGSREPVGIYTPSVSGTTLNLELTVAPGMEVSQVFAPESYEIEVPAGLVNFMQGENWNGSNVTVIIDNLTCEAPMPGWGELADHVTYNSPGALEANPGNTRTPLGVTAMGVISLGVDTRAIESVAGPEKINYYYSPTATGEQVLLKSLDPANGSEVLVLGAGSTDEDPGLAEFPPVTYLYLIFAGGTDGDIDFNAVKDVYSKDGYYTLVIPDGAFMVDGQFMNGLTLTYHYDSTAAPADFEYTLTPADGTEIKDPKAVFGPKGTGSGIVLEIKDATFVDCLSKPATLTLPNGTEFSPVTPTPNFKDKLTWNFGTKDTEWPNGTYTFTVHPGKVGVNMGWAEDWAEGEEGNFPGLTALYSVDTASAVLVIGAEPAEAYTVVTLDGKVVLNQAPLSQLHGLAPGVYVVNGKKAVLRK